MKVPEEERQKETERLFEGIMAKNFLNLGKGTYLQIQEVLRTLCKINPRRPILKNIIIKLSKARDKERILKATREN